MPLHVPPCGVELGGYANVKEPKGNGWGRQDWKKRPTLNPDASGFKGEGRAGGDAWKIRWRSSNLQLPVSTSGIYCLVWHLMLAGLDT